MSVNYNAIRTMKGMAVGTIIPWAGQLGGTGGIPKGWLPCVGGRSYRISEYPDLYDVIGNRYGGSATDGNFLLPNITSKSLGDYHPSHSSVTNIGYTGNFSSFLGTNNDIANQNIVTQSSNIDLFVNFDNDAATTMKATAIGHNINQSSYTDTYGVVDRRLGDAHLASHTHNAVLQSVKTTNDVMENCQDSGLFAYINGIDGIDCPGACNDNCSDVEYYRCTNGSNQEDDLCIPKYDGGEHLGCGRTPYGTQSYRMQRTNTPDRNYILESDDCVLYNVTANTGCTNTNQCGNTLRGIYGTTLHSNAVNFQNASLSGHSHRDVLYTINTGNTSTKQIVNINTVYTDISPSNNLTKDIMTIEANVNTASIQMLYIIKAY